MSSFNIDKPVDIDERDIERILRNKFKEPSKQKLKRSDSLKRRRRKRRMR